MVALHVFSAAYCDHPVRFGVVESLNTTIKGIIHVLEPCEMRPCCFAS